jgi:hypothetical protein
MWKRAWLRIQWYDTWTDLTTGKSLSRLLKGVGASHSLERVKTRSNNFLIKKYKIQCENTKMPLMILLITQNTQVKIPKYPQRKSFFFCPF